MQKLAFHHSFVPFIVLDSTTTITDKRAVHTHLRLCEISCYFPSVAILNGESYALSSSDSVAH